MPNDNDNAIDMPPRGGRAQAARETGRFAAKLVGGAVAESAAYATRGLLSRAYSAGRRQLLGIPPTEFDRAPYLSAPLALSATRDQFALDAAALRSRLGPAAGASLVERSASQLLQQLSSAAAAGLPNAAAHAARLLMPPRPGGADAANHGGGGAAAAKQHFLRAFREYVTGLGRPSAGDLCRIFAAQPRRELLREFLERVKSLPEDAPFYRTADPLGLVPGDHLMDRAGLRHLLYVGLGHVVELSGASDVPAFGALTNAFDLYRRDYNDVSLRAGAAKARSRKYAVVASLSHAHRRRPVQFEALGGNGEAYVTWLRTGIKNSKRANAATAGLARQAVFAPLAGGTAAALLLVGNLVRSWRTHCLVKQQQQAAPGDGRRRRRKEEEEAEDDGAEGAAGAGAAEVEPRRRAAHGARRKRVKGAP